MGTLLRVGVVAAAVLVATGSVGLLLQRWDQVDRYGTFTGVAAHLTSPVSVVRAAFALDPAALVVLGLIVLVLTPVARVAFALLAFVKQRDLPLRRVQRDRSGGALLRAQRPIAVNGG